MTPSLVTTRVADVVAVDSSQNKEGSRAIAAAGRNVARPGVTTRSSVLSPACWRAATSNANPRRTQKVHLGRVHYEQRRTLNRDGMSVVAAAS
jgi:hypothetical protein